MIRTLLILFLLPLSSYSLPKCEGEDYKKWTSCVGTYTFSNGDKYVGEFKDDKFHGKGTYTFANGNKYVGEWKNDKKHGKGTYTFADGRKYIGEWKNGKRYKKGTIIYPKDPKDPKDYNYLPKCEGDDFKKWNNCYGIYVWSLPLEQAMTDRYIKWKESVEYSLASQGRFWDAYGPGGVENIPPAEISNMPESKEKILSKSLEPLNRIPNEGDKYEGDWKDGMLHGKGTYTWAVGHKYVGGWKNGKMHGKGTFTNASGSKYVGEFWYGEYEGK